MKNVILSAGGPKRVYSVPDRIADHLESACWYFCSVWILDGPECRRFIKDGVLCYNDRDFIDYLNKWEAPEFESVFVENIDTNAIAKKYKNCPRYTF